MRALSGTVGVGCLALILLLASTHSVHAVSRISAAIIPIGMPEDLPPSDRLALLSRLIAEVALTDSMHVVKMSEVENALRSLGLKQARQCMSANCWKKAARTMRVDRIIALSITKEEDGCRFEAILANGSTGAQIVKVERTAPCTSDDLKNICPEVAQALTTPADAPSSAPPSPPETPPDSMERLLALALKETARPKQEESSPDTASATTTKPSPAPDIADKPEPVKPAPVPVADNEKKEDVTPPADPAKDTARPTSKRPADDKRFRIALSGSGYLPFNLFEPNAADKMRAYFGASLTDTALAIPELSVEFSGMLKLSLRASGRVWVSALFSYARTRTRETSLKFHQTVNKSIAVDTYSFSGVVPEERWKQTRTNENFLDFGLGVDIDFLRTARAQIGMSLAPQAGLAIVHLDEFDSTYTSVTDLSIPAPYQVTQSTARRTVGDLTSLTVGGGAGLDAEILFTPHFGLRLDLGASWKIAPWLQGVLDGRATSVTQASGYSPVRRDTVYLETRSAMKGNYLGTGEYVDYVDPTTPLTTPGTGTSVLLSRRFKEYADARLGAGLVFYF